MSKLSKKSEEPLDEQALVTRVEEGRKLMALLDRLAQQDRDLTRLSREEDNLALNPWLNAVILAAAPAKHSGGYNVQGAYYPDGDLLDEEALWAIKESGWRIAGPGYGYNLKGKISFNAAIVTRDKKVYVALLDLDGRPAPDWVAREETRKNAE